MIKEELLNEARKIAGEFNTPHGIYINVYLNLDGRDLDQDVRNEALVRKSFDVIANSLPKHGTTRRDYRKFRSDFWQAYESFPESDKGVFMTGFGSDIRTIEVRVPLERKVVLSSHPYVFDLEAALNNAPSLNVLLVDSHQARFFEYSLGEMAFKKAVNDEVPDKVKVGGWSQMKIERHIGDHVLHHFKNVAKEMDGIANYRNQNEWLVFGQHDNVVNFLNILPKSLKEKVVGTGELDIRSNVNDISRKVESIFAGHLKNEADTVTESLITAAKKNARASLGLKQTLDAVNGARVEKLFLSEDFRYKGYYCPSLGEYRLTPDCGHSGCPVSEANLEEAMVEKVMATSGIVEITDNPALKKQGGVGALLRY